MLQYEMIGKLTIGITKTRVYNNVKPSQQDSITLNVTTFSVMKIKQILK